MTAYYQITFAISLSFFFWFIGKNVFPIFQWKPLNGRNGKNSLFRAVVDPTTPFGLAVAAQEISKSEYKWKLKHFVPILY